MQLTSSEQAVLKLYDKKSKINYKFFAILCWAVVWPSIIYFVLHGVSMEELHTVSYMMLMGMICSIFYWTKAIILKYQARIAELER